MLGLPADMDGVAHLVASLARHVDKGTVFLHMSWFPAAFACVGGAGRCAFGAAHLRNMSRLVACLAHRPVGTLVALTLVVLCAAASAAWLPLGTSRGPPILLPPLLLPAVPKANVRIAEISHLVRHGVDHLLDLP